MPVRAIGSASCVLHVVEPDGKSPLAATDVRTVPDNMEEIQPGGYRIVGYLIGTGKDDVRQLLNRYADTLSPSAVVTVFDPNSKLFWKVTSPQQRRQSAGRAA